LRPSPKNSRAGKGISTFSRACRLTSPLRGFLAGMPGRQWLIAALGCPSPALSPKYGARRRRAAKHWWAARRRSCSVRSPLSLACG
jgi:hypothetical protein